MLHLNEADARAVLLLQACETAPERALWQAEDRAWATAQALAVTGEGTTPERFVVTRARLALSRLLPRDDSLARWLAPRPSHGWSALAGALAGAVLGFGADRLGPPQQVNVLAPAVWAVVAWNLAVFLWTLASLALRARPGAGGMREHGLRALLARWVGARAGAAAAGLPDLRERWAALTAPLTLARVALVLHAAAIGLALALLAGMYLRGLVLDYRAGWQSTFLVAPQVQALLDALLAPAAWLTGIAVPAVAPLQVGPGQTGQASAAPWIHLYAATLALAVLLPRALLLALAALRAAVLARRLPLPLDAPYFEGLHPVMRPGRSRRLVLLWAGDAHGNSPAAQRVLLGRRLPPQIDAPLQLLASAEGDELWLEPPPVEAGGIGTRLATVPAVPGVPAPPAARWWQAIVGLGGLGTAPAPGHWTDALRGRIDAVLWWPATPTAARPAWLAEVARPIVDLPAVRAAAAGGATHPPASAPPLDAGLPDRALWLALIETLGGDGRAQRLALAWQAEQRRRREHSAALLAETLARTALQRAPVEEGRMLGRSEAATRAQAALTTALQRDAAALALRLAEVHGLVAAAPTGPWAGPDAGAGRLPEGRAAVLGGVASGALMGLKADLATGGLSMGLGLVGGAIVGALTAAGVARGVNVVRGVDGAFVAWPPAALEQIGVAAVVDALAPHEAAHAPPDEDGAPAPGRQQALQARALGAWARHKPALDDAWAEAVARRRHPAGPPATTAAPGGAPPAQPARSAKPATATTPPVAPAPPLPNPVVEGQPETALQDGAAPDREALAARLRPLLDAVLRDALAPPAPPAGTGGGPGAAAYHPGA